MALNVADKSYSGTFSDYFIQRATYQMDTIRKGVVHIVSDIGKAHTIGRIDYQKPLRPRMATPVAADNSPYTMDGRILYPKSFDVYERFNPRDLEENQLADQLSETILDRQVPQGLQEQLVQLTLNRAGEESENMIWVGSTDYVACDPDDPRYQWQFIDGFMKRLIADPLVNLSSITPALITISNISTILDDLITQATKKDKALVVDPLAKDRMRFLGSPMTEAIYTAYLRTGEDFKGMALNDGSVPRWSKYEFVSLAGMPDNTILFCRATDESTISNLYVGMNSMKDWELRVNRVANDSEEFFIQGKWKMDVNYGWPQEIFMFTNLTAANFTL